MLDENDDIRFLLSHDASFQTAKMLSTMQKNQETSLRKKQEQPSNSETIISELNPKIRFAMLGDNSELKVEETP